MIGGASGVGVTGEGAVVGGRVITGVEGGVRAPVNTYSLGFSNSNIVYMTPRIGIDIEISIFATLSPLSFWLQRNQAYL